MTGTIPIDADLRLYPPMLTSTSFPRMHILLRTVTFLLLLRGTRRTLKKMPLSTRVKHILVVPEELPYVFDLAQWRQKVRQLNKEIIIPETKAERLFLLIEQFVIEQYSGFQQLPPYEELYRHTELPGVIIDTIKQLYSYIYADENITHGDIKQLTDRLLSELI